MLYIFIFLHQTTTIDALGMNENELYIFIFLHQTTTDYLTEPTKIRCISLYSYTKPQPA